MKDMMKAGNSFAFLYHDVNQLEHSKQANLPRVTVIMPLKGFGEHNLHNWRSQVTCMIFGFSNDKHHFIFEMILGHLDQVALVSVIFC